MPILPASAMSLLSVASACLQRWRWQRLKSTILFFDTRRDHAYKMREAAPELMLFIIRCCRREERAHEHISVAYRFAISLLVRVRPPHASLTLLICAPSRYTLPSSHRAMPIRARWRREAWFEHARRLRRLYGSKRTFLISSCDGKDARWSAQTWRYRCRRPEAC